MFLAALAVLAVPLQAPIAEIDFEITNGRIYMQGEMNGRKTSVILDSGAGTAVMDLDLANELKLASAGNINANGIGKETVPGKLLTNAKVSFGGLKEPVQAAIPLTSLGNAEGRRMEAIIGYQFLRNHVVEIDYAKRHLRVFEGQSGFQPRGTATPIRLVQNHPHISTSAVVGGKAYDLETMIDTGATSGGFTAKFLKTNPLNVSSTARTVIGGGVGGYVEGRFFRPDSIKIGGVSLTRPVVSMNDSEGGASGLNSTYDILLGADFLRRFKVTFDYPHGKMYFEPNADVTKPFEADKVGVRMMAEGPNYRTFRIKTVLEGSSAAQAGLKEGDVIETINGTPASNYALQELREQFRSANAKGWDLGIRRGEQSLKVRVEAKSVI